MVDGGEHCCNYRSLCVGVRSSQAPNTSIMFVFAESNKSPNLQWNGNTQVCEHFNQMAAQAGAG